MIDYKKLQNGDKLSFSMIKPGIDGDSFDGVYFDSVIGYHVAKRLDPEIISKHNNFFPFFKEKVNNINNPDNYMYLIITTNSLTGEFKIMGVPWIDDKQFKIVNTLKQTLVLPELENNQKTLIETTLKNANIKYFWDTGNN